MDIIIKKLELRSVLSPDEKQSLRSTFAATRQVKAGEDLLRQGERPAFVGALLSGMLSRYKPLADGHRQIVSFPLPGDIFDLHSFMVETMDHNVDAIARSTMAIATHQAVETMVEAHPRLAMLLWRDAVVEGSVFREWIVNCGRRTAYQRMAHLFCEIYVRSDEVGLASADTCSLPLTQAQLADATGLSVVHVNRTVQQLRSEKLVSIKAGLLQILDWAGLARAGGFNGDYLHARERRSSSFGPAVNGHPSSSSHSPSDDAGGSIVC